MMQRTMSFVGTIVLSTTALWAGAALAEDAPRFDRSVRTAENMEPAIPRPEQDAAAAARIDAFVGRTGKRPNIVWLIVDDMGYGDPGCYGGGAAIGAATPNIDRLAREGLKLTSCNAQQTCTPTRSAISRAGCPCAPASRARFGIDTFGISEDSGSPVADTYTPPFPFTGTIEKVIVELK